MHNKGRKYVPALWASPGAPNLRFDCRFSRCYVLMSGKKVR